MKTEFIINNFPDGEYFRNSIVGISGPPQSGKTLFAITLAKEIINKIKKGLIYFIDLNEEVMIENLKDFNDINMLYFNPFKEIKVLIENNKDIEDFNNRIVIIDPLPVLKQKYDLSDIIVIFNEILKNNFAVIYINYLLSHKKAWFENYFYNFSHFWFTLNLKKLTSEMLESEVNLVKNFNFTFSPISGIFKVIF